MWTLSKPMASSSATIDIGLPFLTVGICGLSLSQWFHRLLPSMAGYLFNSRYMWTLSKPMASSSATIDGGLPF